MEKRFLIALALSLLIMLGYPYLIQKIYPPAERPETEEQEMPPIEQAPRPSVPELARPDTESLPTVEEKRFDYADGVFEATFTNAGGGLAALRLKTFANGKSGGNVLIQKEPGIPAGFSVRVFDGINWNEGTYTLEKRERYTVGLVREESGSYRIEKNFYFLPNQYAFAVELIIQNLADRPQRLDYEFVAPLYIGAVTKRDEPYMELGFLAQGKLEAFNAGKIRKEPHLNEGPVEWMAIEDKYFTVIVKPEVPLEHVRSLYSPQALMHFIKPQTAEISPGGSVKHNFFIYAGPKKYDRLREHNFGFERILHTKVLGGLWIYFLLMLNFFYKLFHNYGVAIIVLSALIKLAFAPLTHMSFDSMRKMQALQPKIKALQEQHKKDPQRLNKEVMELYKRNKVNPFGGCLPLVLQMPIFVALYHTFSQALELRGAPFVWWIKDLSEPDQIYLLPFALPLLGNQINVLPLLMIGTMIWQQKLTPQTAATKEQAMMMNYMPVIFGFVFYSLPSGLVIYWIVNNILTIAHQLLMKKLHISPHPAS
jgi:YidC/Oxa1 family membrane protein insertase